MKSFSKRFPDHFLILVLSVCVSLLVEIQSQYLSVIPVTEPEFNITTDDHSYPGKNIDIIWNISYPAELKMNSFDIDMMAGDFVVVCQYSLPNDERLTTGAAAEDVMHLLPVENSLLLSPELFPEKQISDDGTEIPHDDVIVRISSPHGGFIYFHGTQSITNPPITFESSKLENVTVNGSSGSSDYDYDVVNSIEPSQPRVVHIFEGFNIHVSWLDLNPTPIVPSTTEKLTTPSSGVDIYLKKHVVGRTPGDFYNDLATFKSTLADMGNAYCELRKNCRLSRPIMSTNTTDDVRLTKEMIFFCDRDLPYYDKCVQVQFAITIRDISDRYVMITPRLEEMWNLFAKEYLAKIPGSELQPQETPADDPIMITWVWVAAALGSILALSTILCFTLIGSDAIQKHSPEEHDDRRVLTYDDNNKEAHSSGSSVDFHGVSTPNPIIKIIQSMSRQQHDEEHYGMHELDMDREIAERTKRDLLPYNEMLKGNNNQKGQFNSAFLNDEDEVVHWSPHPPAKLRQSPGSHHPFPQLPVISDYNSDEDSDAIEFDNDFFAHPKPN